MGLGSHIVLTVREMYNKSQQTGCRFLMVDAYCNALPFYPKNRFLFLTEQDANDATRIVYFDLKAI